MPSFTLLAVNLITFLGIDISLITNFLNYFVIVLAVLERFILDAFSLFIGSHALLSYNWSFSFWLDIAWLTQVSAPSIF